VLNNCVKNASKVLSFDIECLLIKVFNEFSTSAKKVEELKEFYAFMDSKYRDLLRHVPTRWLSLLPALNRLISSWPVLKSQGKESCAKVIWEFVSGSSEDDEYDATGSGLPEVYLYFLQETLPLFDCAIRKLENDST
jgi:hypothetical protein